MLFRHPARQSDTKNAVLRVGQDPRRQLVEQFAVVRDQDVVVVLLGLRKMTKGRATKKDARCQNRDMRQGAGANRCFRSRVWTCGTRDVRSWRTMFARRMLSAAVVSRRVSILDLDQPARFATWARRAGRRRPRDVGPEPSGRAGRPGRAGSPRVGRRPRRPC